MSLNQTLAAYQNAPSGYGFSSKVHTTCIGEVPEVHREVATIIGLKNRGPREKTVHIGFGGFLNLDLFLLGNNIGAVFCDLNENQIKFWNELFKVIDFANTPYAFEKILKKLILRKDNLSIFRGFEDSSLRLEIKDIDFSTLREFEFYKNPRGYRLLQQAIRSDNFAAVMLDALDFSRAKSMSTALSQGGYTASSLYLTNLRDGFGDATDYFGRANIESKIKFNATIESLKTAKTIVMDGSCSRSL